MLQWRFKEYDLISYGQFMEYRLHGDSFGSSGHFVWKIIVAEFPTFVTIKFARSTLGIECSCPGQYSFIQSLKENTFNSGIEFLNPDCQIDIILEIHSVNLSH
jgi:hypothetical protein